MMHSTLPKLVAPRVSIVICSHNHGRFVEEAIRSALAQTLPCEVVLIEDGSTDDTRERLTPWHDRLKIVLQDNAGQLAAYERGIRESSGEVVIFLDSDDFLDPQAAETVAARFDAGVAKVHFRLRVVDPGSLPMGATIPRALADGDVMPEMLRRGVLYASAPGSGNAYRRSVLERLLPLPLDAQDRHGADLFMIFGSVFFGAVCAVPEVLGNYRIHESAGADTDGLSFGNAELHDDAQQRFHRRLSRFLEWIPQRVTVPAELPARFLDFGTQKTFFARGLFTLEGAQRRAHIGAMLPDLFRAVVWQPSYSWFMKLCLIVWMFALILLPRRWGLPLARRVCNPASRGRRAASATNTPAKPASTAKALGFVYAGYLVRYVSLLILIPFYGRVLGVEAYGEVLAAMSLYQVVFTLVSHGFSTVGARDIACNLDRSAVAREYGRHLHARCLLALGGVAVGAVGTWISPALRAEPLMGALAIIFALSHAFNLGWFYQGLSEFKLSIALEVFGFLLSLVLILSFVRSPDDNWVVLLSLCISNVLANVIAYRLSGRYMDRAAVRFEGGRALIREATPVFLVGGVATLAVGASSYILSLFASVEEVGYFGSAERVAAIVVALMMPANQVLLSTVSSRLHGDRNAEGGFALMRLALRGMLVCSVLASIAVVLLAPIAVPLVLGPAFAASIPFLQLFALMYPCVAFSQVINMYVLIPLRQDKVAMKVAALGTTLNVILLFGLAALWHGQGAVLARVVGEVLMAVMLGITLARQGLWTRLLRAERPKTAA